MRLDSSYRQDLALCGDVAILAKIARGESTLERTTT